MNMMITIIVAAAGVAAFLLFWLLDDVFDRLCNRVLQTLGLRSGSGPLVSTVVMEEEQVVLTLENQGKHLIMPAALEGRDGKGNRTFPTPHLSGDDVTSPSAGKRPERHSPQQKYPRGCFYQLALGFPRYGSQAGDAN